MSQPEDKLLPTWWWIMSAGLLALMVGIGLYQLQDGTSFVQAMFPAYGVFTLTAIPPIAKEWRRYWAAKSDRKGWSARPKRT